MHVKLPPQARHSLGMLLSLIAMVAIVLLLHNILYAAEPRPSNEAPILSPCSLTDERYDDLGFVDEKLEDWPDLYHNTVDGVITEYLTVAEPICNEEYETSAPAGEKLTALAKKMPIWSESDKDIVRSDLPRVLLEYLRIYECGLQEFSTFIPTETIREERDRITEGFLTYFLSNYVVDSKKRQEIIDFEIQTARAALERTLQLLSTVDRLSPVHVELTCLQRMSLDIRNISGLIAETSSCLPRTWNAKDPLRDIEEDDE